MHYLNDTLVKKYSKQYSNHLYSAVYAQSKAIVKPEAYSNKLGCGIHHVTSIDILEQNITILIYIDIAKDRMDGWM